MTSKIPTVPSLDWYGVGEDSQELHQIVLCAFCPETKAPSKLIYVSGTSMCIQHAQEVLRNANSS